MRQIVQGYLCIVVLKIWFSQAVNSCLENLLEAYLSFQSYIRRSCPLDHIKRQTTHQDSIANTHEDTYFLDPSYNHNTSGQPFRKKLWFWLIFSLFLLLILFLFRGGQSTRYIYIILMESCYCYLNFLLLFQIVLFSLVLCTYFCFLRFLNYVYYSLFSFLEFILFFGYWCRA